MLISECWVDSMRQAESARTKTPARRATAKQILPRQIKLAERERYRQKARLSRGFTASYLPDPASAEISFLAVKRSNRRSGSVINLKRAGNSRSRGVSDWLFSRRSFFSCLLARTGTIPPCYFAY